MRHFKNEKELARKCGLKVESGKLSPIDRSRSPKGHQEKAAERCPDCGEPLRRCCLACGYGFTREEKRAEVERYIKAARLDPFAPDTFRAIERSLPRWLRTDHKTLAGYAAGLERRGEIPQLDRAKGADGKSYPVRPKQYTEQNKERVLSAVIGVNGDLMAEVAKLYLRAGDRIADVTFHFGRFWSRLDLRRFQFFASDIKPEPEYGKHHGVTIAKLDCRKLPYDSDSMDVVVLDPPYSRHTHYEKDYGTVSLVKKGGGWMPLYFEGMAEAMRVVKAGGLVLVKCQDGISGGKQRRYTHQVWQHAMELGLVDEDCFRLILERQHTMKGIGGKIRGKQQLHALKNESCLWVFRKPKPKAKAK